MAVVFFAGHGMEIGGENWLIPVDAELGSDTDAENEAVSLRTVSADPLSSIATTFECATSQTIQQYYGTCKMFYC